MLYLVLFSTLAVGFAAATAMSAQISRNERDRTAAESASDGGMQFMRYQLGSMTIPAGTSQTQLLTVVATQLATRMNGTPNMGSSVVTVNNGTIWIPSQTGWITLDSNAGTKFRASIVQSGTDLVTTVTGSGPSSSIHTAVQLHYQQAQKAGAIFDFGIASAGEIVTSAPLTVTGATDPTKGSILVATAGATAFSNSGNSSSISGDLSYTNAAATNSYGSMTVDGYSSSNPNFTQHVHAGVTPPTFPTIDSSVFLPYATNTYSGSSSASNPPAFVNTVLPANGNYNFSGNVTIQGVLYIMQPNKVSFSGPVNLQGAIVVDTTNGPQGTSATNYIKFTQTVSATAMASLPATSQFPAGERALTDSVILAPNFTVIGTNSFGTVSGSLIAGAWSFSNTFTASIFGSLIQLDDTPMKFTNTATITIQSTGTSYFPAGVTFGTTYTPLQGTYMEVAPQ